MKPATLAPIFAVILTLLAVIRCTHLSDTSSQSLSNRTPGQISEAAPGELPVCVALRGNGELIMAHFGALARITEAYGIVDGMAGGSSGSISTFLYESMLLNPQINQCGKRLCTKEEKTRRMALLLKTLQQYVKALGKTDEAIASSGILALVEDVKKSRIQSLLNQGRFNEAKKNLQTLLTSSELRSIINPAVYKLLAKGRVQEVYDQIIHFGSYETKDKSIFFKPGLINFQKAPELVGKVADFYAGRGKYDAVAMENFFQKCAGEENTGRLWDDITQDPKNPCADLFDNMALKYRKNYKLDGSFKPRHKDGIGETLPSLISTSVLEGKDMVDSYKRNMDAYWSSSTPNFQFDVPFERVKFGYWGRAEHLTKVQDAFQNSKDLKAQKFLPLGPANSKTLGPTNWEEALRTSPAEPGLTNIQQIDRNRLSLGGWSDLHPVQVLKAMGCKNVIYVTRTAPETNFAIGVAKQLGMSEEDELSLYNLEQKPGQVLSSFSKALNLATAIWCTDWNSFTASQMSEAIRDSYGISTNEREGAFLVTQSPKFLKPSGKPFVIKTNSTRLGCDGRILYPEVMLPHRQDDPVETH